MKEIRSTYSISRLLLLLLFFCLATLFLCFIIYSDGNEKFHRKSWFPCIIFTIIFFLLLFAQLSIPQLIINDIGIFFKPVIKKDSFIEWVNIEKIELVPGNSSAESDGLTICKKDGSLVFIPASDYSNMPLIRRGLEAVNRLNQPCGLIDKSITSADSFSSQHNLLGRKVFSGSPLLSVAVFSIISSVIIFISFWDGFFWMKVIPAISFLFFLCGWQMFYFILSGDQLIIRNHLWIWYKRSYAIKNIRGFIYEPQRKGTSQTLRIVLKDFKTKAWQAESLKSKDWLSLKQFTNEVNNNFQNVVYIKTAV